MFRARLALGSLVWPRGAQLIVLALVVANLCFNVIANACFKLSAAGQGWRGFLTWQVVGNLAGFITVLTLTALLRYLPLHVAYPITTGLAVLGVEIVAAGWVFHEPMTMAQQVGALLVAVGIALICRR